MVEKRKSPRFDVCVSGRLPGAATNNDVRISDLSESGCYVDNIDPVFEGEAIVIAILSENDEWVELQGVVVHHVQGLGFGMRFLNPHEAQLRWIHSNIQREADRKEGPTSFTLKQSDVFRYQLI